MRKSFPWPSGLASRFSCLLNSFGGSRKPGLPVGQSCWSRPRRFISPSRYRGEQDGSILLEAKSAFLSMTSPMSVPKTGAAVPPASPRPAKNRPISTQNNDNSNAPIWFQEDLIWVGAMD